MPGDSLDWTPEMALDAAKKTVVEKQPDAALVILLWNQNTEYETQFFNCGLSMADVVALLEIQKNRIFDLMAKGHTV